MKLVVYLILFLALLCSNYLENIFSKFISNDHSVFRLIQILGYTILIVSIVTEAADKFSEFSRRLPIPLWMLLLLASTVGALSALVGGLPYIFSAVDLGLSEDIQAPSAAWYARQEAPEGVKAFRLIAHGAAVGGLLGLLLTNAAYLAINLKRGEQLTWGEWGKVASLPLQFIVLSAVVAYVASHMSEVGKELATTVLPTLLLPFSEFEWVQAFIQNPMRWISFGSGICENLETYWQLPKDQNSNNNYCDVGAIPLPAILLIIGLFVSSWMGLVYLERARHFGRGSDLLVKIWIRACCYFAVSVVSLVNLLLYMEPWNQNSLNAFRQMLIDNSELGSLVFGIPATVMLMGSLWLVVRDARGGFFSKA